MSRVLCTYLRVFVCDRLDYDRCRDCDHSLHSGQVSSNQAVLFTLTNSSAVSVQSITCGECGFVNCYDGLFDHVFNWKNTHLFHHSLFNSYTNAWSTSSTPLNSWMRCIKDCMIHMDPPLYPIVFLAKFILNSFV
eukprot:406654_1